MRRMLVLSCALIVLALSGGSASAGPVPIPSDPVDPLDLSSVLPTALALPGDGWADPSSLVVTDAQLASAGATQAAQLLVNAPDMLIVDDDLGQCPNADFSSIQAAVLAAPVGGHVRVCPGLYEEAVNVLKPLTLQAPRHQGQATNCQQPLPPDPTREAIIEGTGFTLVQLAANDIVFDGFTVQNNEAGPGIYTSPLFSGYQVEHNTVQANVFGIYFNASGATESVVKHNCVRFNTSPGAASSNGVYSDQNLDNASIQDNYFTGHTNASVVLTHTVGVNDKIEITHNSSVDDSSIALFFTTNFVVGHNKIVRPAGSGVFLGGGTEPGEISFNDLEQGSGNGISLTTLLGPTSDIVLRSNRVAGFGGSGIRLGDGVTDTTVETNRSQDNGVDGIRAQSGAVENLIRSNHMLGNAEHDCHDDSAGPYNAPALVANQWINDFGRTENRPGLCKHATVTP